MNELAQGPAVDAADEIGETAERLDEVLLAPETFIGAEYRNEAGQVVAVQGPDGPEPLPADPEFVPDGDDQMIVVQGGKQLIAAEGGVIERDLETGEEEFVADEAASDEASADNDRMANILASRKAPATISRRGERPRRLVSRNGRVYDKDRD